MYKSPRSPDQLSTGNDVYRTIDNYYRVTDVTKRSMKTSDDVCKPNTYQGYRPYNSVFI